MRREVFQLPMLGRAAEARLAVDEDGVIEVLWSTGARVRRFDWWEGEAFEEELDMSAEAVNLGRLNAGAPFLAVHRAYELDSVLGAVVPNSARVADGQGIARVRMSKRDAVAPIVEDIRAGILRSVSVGYSVTRFERIAARDREDGGRVPLLIAREWEPQEISLVPVPADVAAHVRSDDRAGLYPCVVVSRRQTPAAAAAQSVEASMSGDDHRAADPNETAQPGAAGAAPANGQRAEAGAQRTGSTEGGQAGSGSSQRSGEGAGSGSAATGQRAEGGQPTGGAQREEAASELARRAVAEERQRISEIRGLCARHGLSEEFVSSLVDSGADMNEARQAILGELERSDPMRGSRSHRTPAEARRTPEREVGYRDAVTSALLHRFDPGRHQLGDDAREFRGLSLIELARTVLERHNVSTRGMSKLEVAGAAFSMRAGVGYHSTSDFPAILANVLNKSLRSAYESTPRTFARWARRATITDFKPVQRTQLGGAPDLTLVPESGEFTYGTIGESAEVYALATYGRIVGITRQVVINDDLDAFTRVPAAFGAAAADLESDIVYSILTGNPAMSDGIDLFDADHGNVGDASVVNEGALAAAYRLMGRQTGLEGRLIRVLPSFIIVPPGPRSVEARKQMTATTPSSAADVNPYAGRLEVIEEPRLIPDSGEDPWFLAADPSRIDTVEYAYLEGNEGLFTETRMGFEVDGMEVKARHDFAAKAIDWRGLFRNPGAAPS